MSRTKYRVSRLEGTYDDLEASWTITAIRSRSPIGLAPGLAPDASSLPAEVRTALYEWLDEAEPEEIP